MRRNYLNVPKRFATVCTNEYNPDQEKPPWTTRKTCLFIQPWIYSVCDCLPLDQMTNSVERAESSTLHNYCVDIPPTPSSAASILTPSHPPITHRDQLTDGPSANHTAVAEKFPPLAAGNAWLGELFILNCSISNGPLFRTKCAKVVYLMGNRVSLGSDIVQYNVC